jgi:hypothetical protein
MPREWLHTADQLVHGLRGPAENVHVLATAYSDGCDRLSSPSIAVKLRA